MSHFLAFLFLFSFFSHVSLSQEQEDGYSPKPRSQTQSEDQPSIHSKHWPGRLPIEKNKPLLIHDIFIISFDPEKRLARYVAYHLSPAVVWGHLKAERKYISDPLLSPSLTVKAKHYKGASNCDGNKGRGYNRGHLAPLGSFKASSFIYQAQYLSNIAPQTGNLNQGAWRIMEERARAFVKTGQELKILTGPLFGKEGDKLPPCWKAGQGVWEDIPISYWKIIAYPHKSKIKTCAVLIPQNVQSKKVHPKKYTVQIQDIESKTGLSILSRLTKPVIQNCNFLF